MEIVERRKAIESGLPRFYTGKTCKHGHVSERYTSTGGCIACLRPDIAKPPTAPTVDVRALAIADGRTQYTLGTPCKRGHVAARYTSNGQCVVCLRRPRHGTTRITLHGPASVIDAVLDYFNLLMEDVGPVLRPDQMTGGAALAAHNLAKLEAKYGPIK